MIKIHSSQMEQRAIQEALRGNDGYLRGLNADVIRLIAMEADPDEVVRLCNTSKYFRDTICNDIFWWNRIRKDLTSKEERIEVLRDLIAENKTKPQKGTFGPLKIGENMWEQVRSPRDIYMFLRMEERAGHEDVDSAIEYGLDIYFQNVLNEVPGRELDSGDTFKNIAESGHVDLMEAFINKGYTLRPYEDEEISVDYEAGQSGNPEMVTFLLEQVSLGQEKYHDENREERKANFLQGALRGAVSVPNNYDMIDFLLEQGAQLLPEERYLSIPLSRGDVGTAKYLVSKGVVPIQADLNDAINGDHIDTVKYIVEELGRKGILDPFPVPSDILDSVFIPKPDVFRYLVSKGAVATPEHVTRAVILIKLDTLKYLVDELHLPITPNILDQAIRNNIDIVDYLLKHGIKAKDNPISLVNAIRSNDIPLVKKLVEAGADVNYDNGLALKIASGNYIGNDGTWRILKYLLDNGADPTKYGPYSVAPDALVFIQRYIDAKKETRHASPVKRTPRVTPAKTPTKETDQCHAFTRGGKGPQCSRRVPKGEEFCWQHR